MVSMSVHADDKLQEIFTKGVQVDLREPHYEDGVLRTCKGGVILAPDIRIQAQELVYTKKVVDGSPLHTIFAHGDLMMEMGEYLFVGDSLEYDFEAKTGTILNGRTQSGPWFIFGDSIEICPTGGFTVTNGVVTTSENILPEWQISSAWTHVSLNHYIEAQDVRFKIENITLLKLMRFRTNLKSVFEVPLRFYAKWGGKQGPRAGVIYEVISWENFQAFARFDYRFNRGPGGGIETYYQSTDGKETFKTINYAANDNSIYNLHEQVRYRFQGIYHNLLFDDKLQVDLTWDKLSDKDMATDYHDRGLELDTCGRTQLEFLRKEENWIANFLTRVRVNQFQTVKQELPTFATSWRPFVLGKTGIISENYFRASYLDFTYANDFTHDVDYNSTRVELQNRLYRPFKLGMFRATPEVGFVGIYYGNSPLHESQLLILGLASFEVNTSIYKNLTFGKHLVEPYVRYDFLTSPTSNPNQHYIFDIDDGWYRLDMVRIGIRQQLTFFNEEDTLFRKIFADIWTNAFVDTPTVGETFQKVYAKVIWNTRPTLRYSVQTAWNFFAKELDHINFRTDWTVSRDLAFAFEFRHRCAYDWRKVDHFNFILDSFRSEEQLLHSSVSDRRNTLLFHGFYRLNPTWALQFESRTGWNRKHQPNYNEYELDLIGRFRGGWHFRASYQHREDWLDDRIAFYINFGFRRPLEEEEECCVPFLDF